jgi:hypothetical protein
MYDGDQDDDEPELPPNVGPDGEELSTPVTASASIQVAAQPHTPTYKGQMFQADPKLNAPAIVQASTQSFQPPAGPPIAQPGSYANVASSTSSNGTSSGYSGGWNSDVWKQNQEAVAGYHLLNQGAHLKIGIYTDKTFIVRGETMAHKGKLAELSGKFTSGKRQGVEPGWFFRNQEFNTVREYVEAVNAGTIASPAPSAPTQTVHWEVFRPQTGMKVNIEIQNEGSVGIATYVISGVEQNGWLVKRATMYATHDPSNVQEIVIINGEWQIRHFQQRHTIAAIVEQSHTDSAMSSAAQYMPT